MVPVRRPGAERCPSEDLFTAFVGGALSTAEEQQMESHLDQCAECRAVLGAFAALAEQHRTAVDAPLVKRSGRARPPLPSSDQMEHHRSDVVRQRYALEQLIASGGMGSVWLARDLRLSTKVAVKFMDPRLHGNQWARTRFEREAKSAAALRSPHVVQILDFGLHDGAPYLVMELLEGEDLRVYSRRHGRIPLDTASIILTQICKALQLAEEAEIVHRDLKPGNVFLARSGDEKIVKVLDFGLAKGQRWSGSGPQTGTGVLLGTPYYMSPEQVRCNRAIDHRSDLWSVACIAYEMVVGRKPFPGGDLGEVLKRITSESAPRPSATDPSLPAELDGFFERAFERDPAKRHQSARRLAGDFASIVAQHLDRPDLVTWHSGGLKITSLRLADEPIAPPPADDGATTTDATTRAIVTVRSSQSPTSSSRRALWGSGLLLAIGAAVGGSLLLADDGTGAPSSPAGTAGASAGATTPEPNAPVEGSSATPEPVTPASGAPAAGSVAESPAQGAPSASPPPGAAPPSRATAAARPQPAPTTTSTDVVTKPKPKKDPVFGF